MPKSWRRRMKTMTWNFPSGVSPWNSTPTMKTCRRLAVAAPIGIFYRRESSGEFGKLGFGPTVMTYSMLMNAYAKGGQHSKLPQLLKDMSVLNLKPDSVTYLTIQAYVRVGDFKRAFFYHKQMVKSRQLPDASSYKKLKKALVMKAGMKNREDRSAILGIINSTAGLKTKRKEKKDEFWKNKRDRFRDLNSPRGR